MEEGMSESEMGEGADKIKAMPFITKFQNDIIFLLYSIGWKQVTH